MPLSELPRAREASPPTPDAEVLAWAMRVLAPQAAWHRLEVRGLERIPSGPALLVGNHNAGAALVDALFLVRYYRARGFADPVHVLAHQFFFDDLGLGPLLARLGVVPADPRVAERVLRGGGKVLVFPGTDFDSLRPFHARSEVRLHGHRGFARLAARTGVPIVPVANAGGHEALVILHQGRALAERLGLPRLLRWHSFPVALALPWGLALGPVAYLPYIPLPAKVTVEIGEPIPSTDDGVDALYERANAALSSMVRRLYDERRFPFLG